MFKHFKKCLILVLVAFCVSIIGYKTYPVFAESGTITNKYYYNQLTSNQRVFYDAMQYAFDTQQLMSGNFMIDVSSDEHLTNRISQKDLANYALNGDNILMADFKRAKLAFKYDNSQVDFIDFDKLILTIGTKGESENKTFGAYVGCGKYQDYFAQGYSSKEQVLENINQTQVKVSQIIAQVNQQTSFNKKLQYAYESVINASSKEFYNVSNNNFCSSAYGALVLGKADSEGYARALKLILDQMGIENILVFGTCFDDDFNLYKSVWNVVKVDQEYYNLDCFSDDNDSKLIYLDNFMKGSDFYKLHTLAEDNLDDSMDLTFPIANKNYSLTYNFDIESLIGIDSKYPFTRYSRFIVSYDNKGVNNLKSDGLYVAVRQQYLDDYNQIVWSDWFMIDKYLLDDGEPNCKDFESYFEYSGGDYNTQFAITDVDVSSLDSSRFVNQDNTGDNRYNYNKIIDFSENTIFNYISIVVDGKLKDRNSTKPIIQSITPNNSNFMQQGKAYTISVTYDEPFMLKEGYSEKSLKVNLDCSNQKALTNSSLTNIKWDGQNTITFNFAPSPLYLDNKATYTFEIQGLVGLYSSIEPQSFEYTVLQKPIRTTLASNVDELTYCTSPVIVADGAINFDNVQARQKDLVLSNTSLSDLENVTISSVVGNQIGPNQILNIDTYNLNVSAYGKTLSPTNGLDIVFNYPQFFKDNSVSYKLFVVNSSEDGTMNISQIPVVCTQYGILARVESFGLFALVQTVQDTQTSILYVSSDMNGSISNSGFLNVQDSNTFTISPKENYVLHSISLNGNILPLSQENYSGKTYTLTLNSAELEQNNNLRCEFISSSSQQYYDEQLFVQRQEKNFLIAPVIVLQPQSIEMAKGNILHLEVEVLSFSNAPINYQWYKDDEIVQNATQSSYQTKVVQQTQGDYYVNISVSMGGKSISINSEIAKVTLNNYAVIWFLAVFFVIVLILSIFVLVMKKKYKVPDVKED